MSPTGGIVDREAVVREIPCAGLRERVARWRDGTDALCSWVAAQLRPLAHQRVDLDLTITIREGKIKVMPQPLYKEGP